MPIYEYRCEKCGEVTEILQKFSDAPAETCNHCSGHLHRIPSRTSFQLKGSGWYVTDYSDRHRSSHAGKESSKSAEASSGSSSDSSSSSSSDATSGAKTDPPKTETAAPAPKDGGKSDGA